jgi:hypothetical protein
MFGHKELADGGAAQQQRLRMLFPGPCAPPDSHSAREPRLVRAGRGSRLTAARGARRFVRRADAAARRDGVRVPVRHPVGVCNGPLAGAPPPSLPY